MQQRYYDPTVGRFLSVDPAESEFNRYNYASNNPYRFTDPDGRKASGTAGWNSHLCDEWCNSSTGDTQDEDTQIREQRNHDFGRLAHSAGQVGSAAGGIADAADKELTDPKNLLWAVPFEKAIAGFAGLAVKTAALKPIALVTKNREAGNQFRDLMAGLIRNSGRTVRTEVYKKTPFGARFIDIEVSYRGKIMGGIETKVGSSRYTPLQQLKDWWLRNVDGYPVELVRSP